MATGFTRPRFVLLCSAAAFLVVIVLLSTASLVGVARSKTIVKGWIGKGPYGHRIPHDKTPSGTVFGAKHGEAAANQTATADGWFFLPERDQRNFKLSDEQCDVAFPGYYYEIERATQIWEEYGPITEEHVDVKWQKESGMLRLLIYDEQLFIVEKAWLLPAFDVARGLGLLHSINRAIMSAPEPVPNIEFTINVGDWPADPDNRYPTWVLSRSANDTSKWVMPDFGYWSWPLPVLGEYTKVRNEIKRHEPDWKDKKDQAVWRGSTKTNQVREKLFDVSQGKSWSDVSETGWQDGKLTTIRGKGQPLSIPEHCAYRYVLHTEGHSYSGRTKYLLNCHSVSIFHRQEWIEPHSHLYRWTGPDQNMILVERDYSDLDKRMQELLKDDTDALRIASNSVRTFRDRYLTPAAQTCYWRKMFTAWAEMMSFEPELYDRKGKIRGMPFETFSADLFDPSTIKNEVEFNGRHI